MTGAADTGGARQAATLLVNGKVLTLDGASSVHEALAVRDGTVAAVGRSGEIRRLAGPGARVIDLQGRTVIPGLIDSHIHAIRAALSYATEVHWIGTRSIPEALDRIGAAARAAQPGAWLIVAGGWTEQQFREKRRPTQAELLSAASGHPVYVQLFYSAALLTLAGLTALGINSDADLPPRGRLERDGTGAPTGWISGDGAAITGLFARLPTPTFSQKVEGTRRFFRELNRLALTGVVDPGGFNMAPRDYLPVFTLWQDGELTLRVVYSLFAQRSGAELDDFRDLTQLLPMGFGDDLLRFNGIGEAVTWAMYNNDDPTDADRAEFDEVARWAAERRMTLTIHWNNDRSVGQLLDLFERLDREAPLHPLRWSIAHLNDASARSLRRMQALGVGWTMQDAMYFEGEQFLRERGAEAARRAPPIKTALRLGVRIGAGTDAHRVMSHNPFAALQWMLDGRTVGGTALRGREETPTREEALRLYTLGSAWVAHDEARRGSLEVGRMADLAVLSRDYASVPVEEIGGIESLLTMVGGRIVYAAGPFAPLEDGRPGR